MKAVVYTRVSTTEQAKADKASLNVQREKCENYCRSQGWEVVQVYAHEGVPGAKAERPP